MFEKKVTIIRNWFTDEFTNEKFQALLDKQQEMFELLSGIKFNEPEVDETYRMYAIVNTSVYMSPGKMAAQAGHAFVEAYYNARNMNSELLCSYFKNGRPGTKVVLRASEQEILDVHNKLKKIKNVPFVVVHDTGHIFPPDFNGTDKVLTALGVGPVQKKDVPFIADLLLLE